MAEPPHRYVFHPLERRGLVLGLQWPQVAVLAAGAAAALTASRVGPGAAGPVLAIVVLAGTSVAALWPKRGRPLAAWAPLILTWVMRRAAGARLAEEPLEGRSAPTAVLSRGRGAPRTEDRVAPRGVELLEAPPAPGLSALGVIRDRHSGTLGAVVPVEGVAFPLLDLDEQVRRLDGWRTVLGTFARAGTPVRRVQWIQRGAPASAGAETRPEGVVIAGPAVDGHRESDRGSVPAVCSYEAWLVLCVGRGRRGGASRGGIEQLAREVRLLDGQLRNADLRAGDPLDLDGLRGLIGQAHQPDPGRSRAGNVHPWPLASDEAWASLRAGATWHATYWISEWPAVEVSPDFLTPMLLGQVRRTTAVVMAPVPADRAVREVRAARTADAADEELRNRAGFLPSARRHREADGVLRRESELADGHSEYRFSGYVTVTADDRERLEAACVETEQAAQTASMQLLRLYGRQAEAYTWTLPLGRGLA
jgi:hypothetical protein